MQISATRHSSGSSMDLTGSLKSSRIGSAGLAVATCTGGDSGGGICDAIGNVASTIVFDSSETDVVSVAGVVSGGDSVADSAAVATSPLATAALTIAVVGDASASSTLAARDGARRSSI